MIRASLKGMLGRKLRTGLTAFSIVLGVAMVSGAYIVTDTMRSAADELSEASYEGVGAVVTSKTAFEVDQQEGFGERAPVSESLVPRVRATEGVRLAVGEVNDTAKLIGKDGEVVGTQGGPAFAVGVDTRTPGAASLSPFEFEAGGFPKAPGQVAIDAGTAEKEGFKVGDTIAVAGRGPARRFEIVGVATFGTVDSIGSATAAIFELGQAQELFKKQGEVDSILVAGERGVDATELGQAIEPTLPPTAQVESAEEQDRFDLEGLKEFVDVIQTALVAFGGIAIFVGAFIIFNTLSITVAQRAREFALLRTIGASRRQILTSVVVEAVVIGLIASVVGIFAGLGLAAGLDAIFTAIGLDLPQGDTVFKSRTAIVALAVGVGVTTLAGLAPALRATRVDPVAALREGAPPPARRSRWAPYAAALTTAIGVAAIAYGMFAGDIGVTERLVAIGAGSVVLFIGVALLSPRLVRPLASVLGRPAERLGGAAGELARRNSMRSPGRTAVTAAALMIGLALVAFVAVLGQGLRSSYGAALDEQLDADYVLVSEDGFSPFSPEAGDALERSAGSSVVTRVRSDQVRAFGDEEEIHGIDPATWGRVYRFDWQQGSPSALAQLGGNGAIVTDEFAEEHGLELGERFRATAPSGRPLELVVRGVDAPPELDPLGVDPIMVADPLFDRSFETRNDRYVFVKLPSGVSESSTRELERTVAGFPDLKLFTQSEYREDVESQINELLGLLYVLLALSVIVSLFGIVNTLVLAVFERTRELGMLRAVGMTRRQVRRMVRHESIIVALIGAVLGLALGIFLAALVTQALADEGITFALPIGTLIAFLIVAVIAGVLAAILPARRASRLDVLKALQYE